MLHRLSLLQSSMDLGKLQEPKGLMRKTACVCRALPETHIGKVQVSVTQTPNCFVRQEKKPDKA